MLTNIFSDGLKPPTRFYFGVFFVGETSLKLDMEVFFCGETSGCFVEVSCFVEFGYSC